MDFITKWIINIFVLVLIGIVVYSFLPSIWYLMLALTPGVYRPLLWIGLVIIAALPALRSSGP